jgi:hypothetical protein
MFDALVLRTSVCPAKFQLAAAALAAAGCCPCELAGGESHRRQFCVQNGFLKLLARRKYLGKFNQSEFYGVIVH